MLATAKAISADRKDLSPLQIFERLIGKPKTQASCVQEILVGGKKAATFKTDATGRAFLEFESGALKPEKHTQLLTMIDALLAS